MSKKYITDNIKIDGQLLDGSGSAGTSGQVLSSTGSATSWVSGSGLPGGPYLPLSAGSGYPLTGDLFIEGSGTPKIVITDTTNNLEGRIRVANNYMYIDADDSDAVGATRIVLSTDGVGALYLDDNQNATFAGTVAVQGTGDSYFTGNVGIGTTNPDSLVEIENTPASQSQTRMLHLDNNPGNNQGSGYLEISSGTNNQAKTQIEQVSSGGFGLLGNQYIDTNIINRGLSSSAHGNINFATGSSSSSTSIVMTIGGGSQKGNVGIGTTTPTAPLHIEGASDSEVLKVEADTSPYIRWIQNGTNVGFLQFSSGAAYLSNMSNGSFVFRTNNTDKMIITSGGNVGIGTTSVTDAKLKVSGDAYVTGEFSQGVANADKILNYGSEFRANGASIQIVFGRDGNNIGSGAIGADSGNCFAVWDTTSISKKMVVSQTGYVGINEPNPSQRLHVAGNLRVTGAYYDSGYSAGTSGQVLSSTATGTDWITLNDIYYTETEADNRFVNVTGDTMTGGLNMGGNSISDAVIGFVDMGATQGAAPNYNYIYYRITNDLTFDKNRIYELLIDADDNGGYSAIYHIYISQHGNSGNHDRVRFHYVSGDKDRAELLVATDEHVWVRATAKWGRIRIRAIHENEDVSSMPFATTETRPTTQADGTSDFVWNGDNNTFTDQEQWHAGNDGSGSGLDADLLDGNHASAFALSSHNHDSDYVNVTGDTMTGDLTLTGSHPKVILDSSGHVNLELDRGSSSYDANLLFKTAGAIKWRIWNDGSDGTLGIRDEANATEMVTFKTGGNVGIGETNPSEELHISSGNPGIRLQDSDGTDTFGRVHFTNTNLQFYSRNGTSNGVFSWYGSNGTTDTEFMRIAADGNVGIGVTNPSVPLHVGGFARLNGGLQLNTSDAIIYQIQNSSLRFGTNNTERMRIDSSGNVGIGTTSPATNLHVKTTTNAQGITIQRASTTAGAYGQLNFSITTSDTVTPNVYLRGYRGATFDDNYLTINTNSAERIRVLANGNVGIGTTSPGSELEVDGEITTTTLTYPEPGALDSSAYNGEIVYFGTQISMTEGKLMVLSTSAGGLTWYLAKDSTTSLATGMLGIALGTAASDGVLVRGIAKNSAWSSFSEGEKLYLSPTGGSISNSITSDTNDFVRIVGYALGGSKIYFCPDNTYIQNS